MTTHIPQMSASERIEQARRFLDRMDVRREILGRGAETTLEREAFAILRALIEPPHNLESEREAVERLAYEVAGTPQMDAYRTIFAAGIQYAHERWEPADVPSQEQMLRWLGLRTAAAGRPGYIHIPSQVIEEEEI